jgi:diaminopimelate epimerase
MAKNRAFPFYKMSGGGNDFVLFDNRDRSLPADYGAIAKKVCDRKFAIGADGLLAVETCGGADFRMIYYNSDGSRAEMCGNGARCIARFAHLLHVAPKKHTFLTDAGPISAEVNENSVKIKMGIPKDLALDFPLKFGDKEFHVSSLNTGVPHVVIHVDDIERTDVNALGRDIRFHKQFSPAGTNVNFVMKQDEHTLIVRTYERGVEGETLACGTGVVASSLISAARNMVEPPVSCLTRGGDTLKVHFSKPSGEGSAVVFGDVHLEGPATVCFKGEVEL